MAVTLGKRKRISREDIESSSYNPSSPARDSEEDVRAIFRRAFEGHFKPLDPQQKEKQKVSSLKDVNQEEVEGDSDWEGLSSEEEDQDEDEDEEVEVVEISSSHIKNGRASRNEMKAFMSYKPPSLSSPRPQITAQRAKAKSDPDEDGTEMLNAKNDLALQQLLRESHLLETSRATSKLAPFGTNRHKALDLRLQALGAKKSILKQENMPMSHRKGIQGKAARREESRRKEARENGIVLETAVKMKKAEKKRERGVGGPSVGRFRGGTLSLSRRDLASIKGPIVRKGKAGKR